MYIQLYTDTVCTSLHSCIQYADTRYFCVPVSVLPSKLPNCFDTAVTMNKGKAKFVIKPFRPDVTWDRNRAVATWNALKIFPLTP